MWSGGPFFPVKHPDLDKIIERISNALPEISSAEEAGPEHDDRKTDASSLSAPAPMKKSKDFGKALEPDDELFEEEMFLKQPDDQDIILWSLILNII